MPHVTVPPWSDQWDCIQSVEIGSGVTSVGDWAFSTCKKLETATLGSSVTDIGNWAFSNCQKLTTVKIPDSVTSIGACAFMNCRELTSIHLPKGVTTIHPGTFHTCTSLTSITIPNSVVEILGEGTYRGERVRCGAFANCQSLTSVMIPDSVTTIGYMAFYYCGKLTSVTIPGSVTDIGAEAFGYYEDKLAINFSGSAPNFANTSFQDATIEVRYPCNDSTWNAAVTSMYGGKANWQKKHTMVNNTNFQAATCTKDAIVTGTCQDCGFKGNATLFDTATGHSDTNGVCTVCGDAKILYTGTCGDDLRWQLDVWGTLTISGTGPMDDEDYMEGGGYSTPWWWKNCEELITNVVIQDGVTRLGNLAFHHCRNLTSVSIPDSVTSIGNGAFSDCTNLRYVIIGNHVTDIGTAAFYNCTNLTSVAFLGAAPTMGSSCFGKTVTTVYHPCNDPTWTDSVKQNYGGTVTWNGHLYRDYVPHQTATCADNAMVTGTCGNCGATAQVPLPGTVTGHDLGQDGLCRSCEKGLNLIICMERTVDNVFYEMDACIEVYADGVLLKKVCLDIMEYVTQTTIPYTPGKTYTFVWDGIDDCRFDIKVDENILASGRGYGYSEGETIYALENLHFHQYEAVITPPTCSTIGSVTYTCATCGERHSAAVPTIGHRYVNGLCTGCHSGEFPTGGSCGIRVNWQLDAAGNLTLSGTGPMNDYTATDDSEPSTPWYRYRELITKVVIENGITTIGAYAFHGCTNLTNLTIPDSVTTIGKLAFYNCTGLRSMTIPKGVTTIGSAAFRLCSNLTSVTIPEGVITIGKIAFFDCTGLKSVTIPKSVTSIGEYAFGRCAGLTTVTFRGNAPAIDSTCFINVTATAHYPCNDKTWTADMKQSYSGKLTWKIGHNFRYIPVQDATCTEDAIINIRCSICGTTETTVVPGTAMGHHYENGVCTGCGDGNPIIPIGDLNGDGEQTIVDVARLYAHVKGTLSLEADVLPNADVTGDGTVNIADTARLYAHVQGVVP